MQTKHIKFLFFIVAFFLTLSWISNTRSIFTPHYPQHLSEVKACAGEHCFLVQVARTTKQQELGLMFKSQLAADKGMIFVFQKPNVYSFWMKNMAFALDIIWIKDNKIIYIEHSAPPCAGDTCPALGPNLQADNVLELQAGITKSLGIKEGDQVFFGKAE